MKKRGHLSIVICTLFVVLLLGAAILVFIISGSADKSAKATKKKTVNEVGVRTFADWTNNKLFQTIPVMLTEDCYIGEATDYGAETYVVDVNGTSLKDYQEYLVILEENGFAKYCDNGEKGLDDTVYTSTYVKDELVVTVTHVISGDKTYIAACEDMPLSKHLIYNDEFVKNNDDERKTKVHMLELYEGGNSFVIQLKNGHFILNDGGTAANLPYLLDYLEELTPEGEKPVVEAWIISHAHSDHMGAFAEIISKPEYAERLFVEEVYFSEPSETVAGFFDPAAQSQIRYTMMAYKFYKTTEGTAPNVYRIQTGQRYFFSDITMEVVLTQEQMLYEDHYGDFNDTSTWLMYNIEGQKFLLCGDACMGAMALVMNMYNEDYFELDVYSVFHHGINVWKEFVDFCTFKTLVYPSWRSGSSWADGTAHAKTEENAYLQEKAVESMSYGDGTKILTFPYEVGTAESLPGMYWKNKSSEQK